MRIAEVRTQKPRGVGCSGDPGQRCGNGLEEVYPTSAVRFGFMKNIGEFSYAPDMKFNCGGKVVIQTHRGIEIGDQISLTCTGCEKSISRDQMRAYASASKENYFDLVSGKILREASADDLHEERHIREAAREKLRYCMAAVKERRLPMKMVECEHLFGGERIIFYFMAENRVDFRELVRELAHEYHTRIEMRQIGARDEARLLADYETCGMECCCKTFLKTLKPISMKMAKLQKATLDPSKVSGRCGRLKCCLRYEHETYEELDRKLPRIGKRIHTSHGDGIVVDRQLLTQLVQIELDDLKRVTVVAEDILGIIDTRKKKTPPEPPAAPREDGGDSPAADKAERQPEKAAQPAESEEKPKRKRRRRRRRSRRPRSEGGSDAKDSPTN